MNRNNTETIAAIATAKGPGGVGIVRVSGPKALDIGKIITNKMLPVRQAIYTEFLESNGVAIDLGLALFFRGPNSFTGEDVLELQGHGGQVVLDSLLARVLDLGASLARPGEFSERAFLNNKIDLVQAEAVAALISAQSAEAARAAVRSLQGDFSKIIHALVEDLILLRQQVEAAIDFSEEQIDFIADGKVLEKLILLQAQLQAVLQQAKQGALLTDGIKTVIVGKANAGKSSLLNLLAGEDTAIVTDIPGTTRDLLKVAILLEGVKFELTDTAGLRETEDVVEKEGIRRAWGALEKAELVVLVVDCTETTNVLQDQLFLALAAKVLPETKFIIVYNKIDLLGIESGVSAEPHGVSVRLSAKNGDGFLLLKDAFKKTIGINADASNVFIARRRHLVAITEAKNCIENSILCLKTKGCSELVAEELRLAQQALSEITGEFSSDDLLGRIFSEFCIGK